MGMAAWVVWDRYLRNAKMSTLLWSLIELIVIATAALWLWNIYFVIASWLPRPYLSQVLKLSGSAWLFAIVIVCFASGRGYIGRLLSARLCVFLGEVSFSVYMVHQILMKAAVGWLPKESIHTIPFVCVLLICATVLHLYIVGPEQFVLCAAGVTPSRRRRC